MVLVWVRRPSGPVDLEAETAKPAAHTRAESRGSPRTRATWGERQTLRWREMDSNFQFRARWATVLRYRPRRGQASLRGDLSKHLPALGREIDSPRGIR